MITAREISLARLVLPHLRKAVTISDILEVRTIERERMAEALDALRCGVVLTDERGGILHANRSAEAMLRGGGPIRSVRGSLVGSSAAASRALLRAIENSAAEDAASAGAQVSAISLNDDGQPPAYAHVLPMTTGDLRAHLQPRAAAAIFIDASEGPDGVGLAARAFNLTSAETRILESLVAGRTLAETARHFGIAPSTAKTHLDHIFGKAGVSRQAELVRLTMQMTRPIVAKDAQERS